MSTNHEAHFGKYCVCGPEEFPSVPQLPAGASLAETATTGNAITWGWAAIPGASSYVLEVSTNPGFTSPTLAYSGPLLSFQVTGLNPGTLYYARYKGVAAGATDSPWTPDSATTAAPPAFTAYWGWADDNSVGSSLIGSAQGNGSFASGATVVADYRANNQPKWLYMLEPIAQPLKTKWFGSVINQGNISLTNDSEAFRYRGTVNQSGITYNVYMSTFATQQTQTVIEFRVS